MCFLVMLTNKSKQSYIPFLYTGFMNRIIFTRAGNSTLISHCLTKVKQRTGKAELKEPVLIISCFLKGEIPNIYFRNVVIFFLKSLQANSAAKKYLSLPDFLVFVFVFFHIC